MPEKLSMIIGEGLFLCIYRICSGALCEYYNTQLADFKKETWINTFSWFLKNTWMLFLNMKKCHVWQLDHSILSPVCSSEFCLISRQRPYVMLYMSHRKRTLENTSTLENFSIGFLRFHLPATSVYTAIWYFLLLDFVCLLYSVQNKKEIHSSVQASNIYRRITQCARDVLCCFYCPLVVEGKYSNSGGIRKHG